MLSRSVEQHETSINKLAEALESHLFKTAPSLRHYADTKTLPSRIRILTVTLLRRRLKKRQSSTRAETLHEVLGAQKLIEVSELVQQVKQLRLKRLTRDCQQCQTDETCSRLSTSQPSFKVDEKIPRPARLLFFETAIVNAYENAPLERIPQLDWETMIEQARNNIQIYNEWVEESLVEEL